MTKHKIELALSDALQYTACYIELDRKGESSFEWKLRRWWKWTSLSLPRRNGQHQLSSPQRSMVRTSPAWTIVYSTVSSCGTQIWYPYPIFILDTKCGKMYRFSRWHKNIFDVWRQQGLQGDAHSSFKPINYRFHVTIRAFPVFENAVRPTERFLAIFTWYGCNDIIHYMAIRLTLPQKYHNSLVHPGTAWFTREQFTCTTRVGERLVISETMRVLDQKNRLSRTLYLTSPTGKRFPYNGPV